MCIGGGGLHLPRDRWGSMVLSPAAAGSEAICGAHPFPPEMPKIREPGWGAWRLTCLCPPRKPGDRYFTEELRYDGGQWKMVCVEHVEPPKPTRTVWTWNPSERRFTCAKVYLNDAPQPSDND